MANTNCRRTTSTRHRDDPTQAKLCFLYIQSHVPDRAFTAMGTLPSTTRWARTITSPDVHPHYLPPACLDDPKADTDWQRAMAR